jgi:predicted dehydrogenase
VKVIVAGAGAMARKHLDAYRKIADVEVTAVVNRSRPRAEVLSRDYGIPRIYPDLDEAIAAEKADILSLCLPTAFHPAVAVQAMNRGLHVVCEKPVALTLEGARDMIAASERNKKKLTVVFNRRFNTVWEELVRRLPAIGGPRVYNTQEIRSVRPKLAMHSRSGNGGPVIDCTVHDFDMLLHLFGRAVSVFATGTVFGSNKASLKTVTDFAVDTAHLDVEFASGDRAYLLYAWGFPEGQGYWQYREFFGPDGIVRLMGEFGDEIHHYRKDGLVETVRGLKENGHENIIRLFVDAVKTGGEVPVRAEEALDSLRISLAALKSIDSGAKEKI